MRKKYDEVKALIDNWDRNRDYPALDTERHVNFYEKFPLFRYAPLVIKRDVRVPINKIYGNNWAFQEKKCRGSYPSYSKLDSLLRGFTRTRNDFFKNRRIPPIPLVRIFDNYYLEEGNHRLYLAKILERESLIADIEEYDYDYFLNNSKIFKHSYGIIYLEYMTYLYEISDEELRNYEIIKANRKASE